MKSIMILYLYSFFCDNEKSQVEIEYFPKIEEMDHVVELISLNRRNMRNIRCETIDIRVNNNELFYVETMCYLSPILKNKPKELVTPKINLSDLECYFEGGSLFTSNMIYIAYLFDDIRVKDAILTFDLTNSLTNVIFIRDIAQRFGINNDRFEIENAFEKAKIKE